MYILKQLLTQLSNLQMNFSLLKSIVKCLYVVINWDIWLNNQPISHIVSTNFAVDTKAKLRNKINWKMAFFTINYYLYIFFYKYKSCNKCNYVLNTEAITWFCSKA